MSLGDDDNDVTIRKLPPLDVRPFKKEDIDQIRQLVGDSTMFSMTLLTA